MMDIIPGDELYLDSKGISIVEVLKNQVKYNICDQDFKDFRLNQDFYKKFHQMIQDNEAFNFLIKRAKI